MVLFFPVRAVNHRIKTQSHRESFFYRICHTADTLQKWWRIMLILFCDLLRRKCKRIDYIFIGYQIVKELHIRRLCTDFDLKRICRSFIFFQNKMLPLPDITGHCLKCKQICIIGHTQINRVFWKHPVKFFKNIFDIYKNYDICGGIHSF